MRTSKRTMALAGLCAIFGFSGTIASPLSAAEGPAKPARVDVLETPDGGIQPQAVIDANGTVHLVYFKGEPAAGDLDYTRLEPGQSTFARAVRVNSQPGSAMAIGTIRGGQIALGRRGRVHVVWNGSGSALPKNSFDSTPMLYTRSDSDGQSFQPQRNLMKTTSALDGGGTVAADRAGNVYVAWHGKSEDAPDGEVGRRMWVARSNDDGAHFAPEEPAVEEPTGACGCCGTRAFADHRGRLYLLYRTASSDGGRDLYLLTSRDRGTHFRGTRLDPWKLNACPMSSASLAESPSGVLAAWETEQKVYFVPLDPESSKLPKRIAPPGTGDRKHPAVAGNDRGETILVWAEGTGWMKGGSLAWQLFDPSGRPVGEIGRVKNGVPTWSLPTVVAKPDGGFLIIH